LLQLDTLALDFVSETHTPPENNPQKSQFFKIPDNFSSQLKVVIEVFRPAIINNRIWEKNFFGWADKAF